MKLVCAKMVSAIVSCAWLAMACGRTLDEQGSTSGGGQGGLAEATAGGSAGNARGGRAATGGNTSTSQAGTDAGSQPGGDAGTDTGGQAGTDAGGQAGTDAGGQAGADAGGQAGDECQGQSCAPPSCQGLQKICGEHADLDCCASNVVPGGMFYRGYNGQPGYTSADYPATISDFRLDNFEISLGRFRKFIAAYAGGIIAAGSGKNPHNPIDPGWNADWNAQLASDRIALSAGILNAGSTLYYDESKDNLPISGISWFEAEAFCIWDGGRLPTEAEWHYAASGGLEQRIFPWGSEPPDTQHAVFGSTDVAPVGSHPQGDGKWGQSDLAGNVWEWVEDSADPTTEVNPYPMPCADCANLATASGRTVRGSSTGAFSVFLQSPTRTAIPASQRQYSVGARCARAR
jgi:sulfatase modifying factor 1